MKKLLVFVVGFFERPMTRSYRIWSWVALAIVYGFLFWMMLNLSGCSSFEHTTKYKPNTYWKMEEQNNTQSFTHQYSCPKCKVGVLMSICHTTFPPSFETKCNKCGYVKK